MNEHTEKQAESAETTRPGRTYSPNVDIWETEDKLWLWADMPGVDESSVDVQLRENVLSISGQVDAEDYENLSPVYTEYCVGNYTKRFTLSNAIDHEGIRASVRDGVLELELPKVARARARRIEVATG
ncbi:MAG: Hsp20/alpha crystallin family protein [Myxococcota bacterium]